MFKGELKGDLKGYLKEDLEGDFEVDLEGTSNRTWKGTCFCVKLRPMSGLVDLVFRA